MNSDKVIDSATTLLNGTNAWFIVIFLLICFVLVFILVATGRITINTKHFSSGVRDLERQVLRKQVDWTKLYLEGIETSLPLPSGIRINKWRTKCILKCINLHVVDWITFNHIDDTAEYIENKQLEIHSLLGTLVEYDQFLEGDFKKFTDHQVEFIIKHLYKIRQQSK